MNACRRKHTVPYLQYRSNFIYLWNAQKRVWEILDVAPESDRVSQIESTIMFSLILLNATALILSTVESLNESYSVCFTLLEDVSVVLFTLEYLGRLWSCTVLPEYRSPFLGRLRFVFTLESLIDLLAILPFYLSFADLDLRILWLLRLLRIFPTAQTCTLLYCGFTSWCYDLRTTRRIDCNWTAHVSYLNDWLHADVLC